MTRPYDAEPATAGMEAEPTTNNADTAPSLYDLVLHDNGESSSGDGYENWQSGLNLLSLQDEATDSQVEIDFAPDSTSDRSSGQVVEKADKSDRVEVADTLPDGVVFKQPSIWLEVGQLKLDKIPTNESTKKETGNETSTEEDQKAESETVSNTPEKVDDVEAETKSESDLNAEKEQVKAEPQKFESADGKGEWKQNQEGNWSLSDATGKDITTDITSLGSDTESSSKIQEVEPQSDKSVKLTLDDGSVVRTRPDGSVLKYPDQNAFDSNEPSDLFKPNGTRNSYSWENGRLKHADLKNPFYEVGDNIWSQDPDSRTGWHGKVELDGATGDLRVTALSGQEKDVTNLYRSNGRHEIHRPDGSVEFTFKAEGDSTERTFKFEAGFESGADTLEQPLEMRVKNEDGKVHTWKRQKGNTYKLDGSPKQAKIEVSQNENGELSYRFENLDTGYIREVSNGRNMVTDPKGDVTETKVNDTLVEASIGGTRMLFDEAGEPATMEQTSENRLWTKGEDGQWHDQALDSSKPYEAPDQFSSEIAVNEHLEDRQKQRMLENIQAMENEGYPEQETQKLLAETRRIMSDNPDAVFSPKQRADLAEQMLWHTVNERNNDQGVNPSCSVTHLRGMLLHDKPSVVAGLMADIAHTGQFKTADGSTITPPLDSLQVRKDSPEATFPPADSARSWLSQVWDVTAYNVHYQRQAKDRFSGSQLNGEGISYELREAKSGDSGCRLVKTNGNGEKFVLAKNYTDNSLETHTGIGLYMSQALDVYNQIAGETLEGRAFAHSTRYVGEKDIYEALGGEKWSSLGDLETSLAEVENADKWPIYVDLQTSIIKQRKAQQIAINEGRDPNSVAAPTGGHHLMMVTGYDPASKTVEIDNSWGKITDFATREQLEEAGIDPATRVTFSTLDLYNSMQRKSNSSGGKTFRQWFWMRDR